ncbi:hypothetical protein DB347_21160 [Opitutaceae bacterium EW11]|nr:hypothetical protein DB347_21160 [Opitutaceae bacterium EW11]
MRILRLAIIALFAALAAAVVGLVLLISGVFGRRTKIVRTRVPRPAGRKPAPDGDVIDVAAHEVTEGTETQLPR